MCTRDMRKPLRRRHGPKIQLTRGIIILKQPIMTEAKLDVMSFRVILYPSAYMDKDLKQTNISFLLIHYNKEDNYKLPYHSI